MAMKIAGWDIVVPLAAFTVWTLTSFLCHKLAKMALLSFSHKLMPISPLAAPALVTLWQVTMCYATVNFTARRGKLFLVMATTHIMATLATNTSLALIFASSTMAVKLLEPMTSALIQSFVLKAPLRAESAVSMAVIVAGAVMFVGDPLRDTLFFKGVWMALVSNVVLGMRNVSIKLDQSNNGMVSLNSSYQILSYTTFLAFVTGGTYTLETVTRIIPVGSTYFLALCLASSLCHMIYSYVSTNIILRYISVVGHALANIVKRVLVVLLLHFSGRRLASRWNWVGLAICTLGLLLYNGRKISAFFKSSSSSANILAQTVENQGKSADSYVDTSGKTTLLYRLLVLVLSLYLVYFIPFDSFKEENYASDLRHGRVKWRDGHILLKDNITYQPPAIKSADKVDSFLKENLLNIANNTDQLSPYLKTPREVTDEAARVHTDLLSRLIGEKKYAILIGAASFENKGDPAITIGELKLLEKLKVKLLFYINEEKCSNDYFRKAVDIAKLYTSQDLVILMQGGGNLIGYSGVNECREKAMLSFPSFQIILLSQSVYMRGSEDWVSKMVNLYCCKRHLTIFLRDRLSYYIASRLFTNGTKLILAPDMAFGVGCTSRFSPPFYDVLWLKRTDEEKPRYDALPDFPSGVTVHVADWWKSGWNSPRGTTTVETAHNELQSGLLFLQRGRVVITERLHGHILSTLLDIPHVILDNQDNKLSSYYKTWTKGLRNVRLAHSPKQAVEMSMQLLKEYETFLPLVLPAMHIKEH